MASGVVNPTDLQQPNDGTGRLFVLEQRGAVRIIQNGALSSSFFLDIRSKVDFGGEKGLLGLAFHPSYAQNRRFFLNYTRVSGSQLQSVIAEYLVSTADPNAADPASERILRNARGCAGRRPRFRPRRPFDPPANRLFLADVGQSDFEEVDLIVRGGNYGWNIMEGAHCFPPSTTTCNRTGLILPIAEYGRQDGGSVTGGYVYRGTRLPQLIGTYVFGDFLSGNIWGLRETSPNVWERTVLLQTSMNISSFGQDRSGEIYVLDYRGSVFRLDQAS